MAYETLRRSAGRTVTFVVVLLSVKEHGSTAELRTRQIPTPPVASAKIATHPQNAAIVSSDVGVPSAIRLDDDAIDCSPTKSVPDVKIRSHAPAALAIMQASSFLFVLSLAVASLTPAPFLIQELGAEKATSFLSIVAASAAASEIVLSPLVGTLLDSAGRKPAMTVATLTATIAHGAAAARPGVISVSIAKVAGMLCASQFFVASQAVIGDFTAASPEKIGAVMGRQFALVSFAFLLGAVVAGKLSHFGPSMAYGASTGLLAVAGALLMLGMPETLSSAKRTVFNSSNAWKLILESPLSCTRLLFRHGRRVRILGILMMIQCAPQFMGDLVQVFASNEWGLGQRDFSNIIALFGLSGILANIIASLIVPLVGMKVFASIAILSSLAFPIGACISHKTAIIGSCVGFLASSQMLGITAALTSEGTKSGLTQGKLAGERASLMALMKVIGPVWYSTLYLKGQGLGLPHLPFLFNIFLSVLALAFMRHDIY